MPRSLLVKNAQVLVTMDDAAPRNSPTAACISKAIASSQVGPTSELPATADEVLDMRGHLVIPGLVNTHHHMYQSLTRAIPAAQNAELFGWLTNLYKIWANLTPEMIDVSTQDRDGRTAALGLHDVERSSLHLSERQPARRQHRGGARDRHALSRGARQHERRAEGRRPAARFGRRKGRRDPEGHAAPDRDVPRRRPLRDAARGRRAVLAVFGEPRIDARFGAARARSTACRCIRIWPRT